MVQLFCCPKVETRHICGTNHHSELARVVLAILQPELLVRLEQCTIYARYQAHLFSNPVELIAPHVLFSISYDLLSGYQVLKVHLPRNSTVKLLVQLIFCFVLNPF